MNITDVIRLTKGQPTKMLDELSTHAVSMPMFVIFCQKEPGTKANKGAKGKKDEKQEAAKEGTTPSENGENKAEECFFNCSAFQTLIAGAPPSTLSVKGQIETVKAQKTESVGDKNE
uniref:Uncharacterized protein n=1 Tax=Pavo cristatus TaxID=9049 RepID=A0A8C9G7J7_PAVCR